MITSCKTISQQGELLNSRSPLGFISVSWPFAGPGNSLKAVSRGNHRAYLLYLPLLKDHCPSLPDVQCLKNHCSIYIVWDFTVLSDWCFIWSLLLHLGWKQMYLLLFLMTLHNSQKQASGCFFQNNDTTLAKVILLLLSNDL